MKREVLRLERVTRVEKGIKRLDNCNLHIFAGEVLGLLCLGRGGQDALVELICRNLPLHYGFVYLREALVNNYRHSDGSDNRVAVIEEHSRLVDALTVADNIFVLRKGFRQYVIRPRLLRGQLARYMEELELGISAGDTVGNLSFFQRCAVELLKAAITGIPLVIVRDVSNFISLSDLDRFHALIRRFAGEGMAFLYLCGHHEEVFSISDRCVIMENERILRVLDRRDYREGTIVPYSLDFREAAGHRPTGQGSAPGVLCFEQVRARSIAWLDFSVRQGECVVLQDVNNTVFPDLLELLQGRLQPEAGRILLDGAPYRPNIRDVSFITENPLETMLFGEMSYLDNLCFLLDNKKKLFWNSWRAMRSVIREYRPLVGDILYETDIGRLSTAQLYDLVYYRIHLLRPRVLLCVQPFSGADMYLRYHLLGLFRMLRSRGITVVILAVNLSDCLFVADRLLVIEKGRLIREYLRGDFALFPRGEGDSAPDEAGAYHALRSYLPGDPPPRRIP